MLFNFKIINGTIYFLRNFLVLINNHLFFHQQNQYRDILDLNNIGY